MIHKHVSVLMSVALLAACSAQPRPAELSPPPLTDAGPGWGIVIHGGAGTIERGSMTPEVEAAYQAELTEALRAGHAILAAGGDSRDAIIAAINIMEDSPLFNAGKGAVFTSEGKNELDAAIMYGPTREAGAVAGVTQVKNPINLARLVMEKSPHVFLIGEGAEAFGREQGVEMVPEDYFYTERRWQSLQRARAAEKGMEAAAAGDPWGERGWKMGTVGAVALDRQGNLAAGTSTGGMTNKKWGRVGDVPVIGAGTYAAPNCAVSATGHGEYFIRATAARSICAIAEYQGVGVPEAAEQVVMQELVEMGGEGGVIAMDGQGNVAMPFNSSGMYRGYMGKDGEPYVAIYRD